MATPRKRWFKVPDEVGASAASNEALAFYLRLGSHLSTRWAADGLESGEAAGRCVLSPGQLAHFAGCMRAERAERVAREFAACFEATFTKDAACYRIEWRKFASLQWPTPGDGENTGNETPPDSPPPRPASRDPRPEKKIAGGTGCSDSEEKPAGAELSPEQVDELRRRVPGLEVTPTVRRKCAALPWREVEHRIDETNAAVKDGKAQNPPGYFVFLLNDLIVERGIRV